MYTNQIIIESPLDAKNFVNVMGKYNDLKIFLYSNHYKIDAHSIMGIISLDMSKPILLEVEDDNIPNNFLQEIKAFLLNK